MFGGNSEAVKSGKVPMANYALVTGKDAYQVLGGKVDCIPLGWRPKAMDVGGEEVISVHDHTKEEFAASRSRASPTAAACSGPRCDSLRERTHAYGLRPV